MHRARIRGPRLHPAHRLHPFFISSLIMSNITQRDLLPALILVHLLWVPRDSNPSPRELIFIFTVSIRVGSLFVFEFTYLLTSYLLVFART